MDKYFLTLKKIIIKPYFRRNLYLITIMTSLFILALAIKGPEMAGRLIQNEGGEIIEIRRESLERNESYEILLEIIQDGKTITKPYTINFKSISGDEETKTNIDSSEMKRAELDVMLDATINELEYSNCENVILPTRLDDGTVLRWNASPDDGEDRYLIIILIYLVLIFMLVKSEMDRENNQNARIREDIMHNLPRFCNQIFLMMNAGMILSDAFDRICISYRELRENELSKFEEEMIALSDANRDHRVGAAKLLTDYASGYSVKELTRIASILAVNETRGSDVVEKLRQESNFLWNDRKLVARERGKSIDTKMAYPMGALLIVLIVITMAPALLNI